jgi:Response regulators consisting of a CheY-like receiver domain and a winged-helix DNA-binding domain
MSFILVVEDEKTINDIISKNLSLVGHTCEQAFDGLAGLNLSLKKNYDLLILDIMLPGLSGFDIIKKLPEIPVIFLTAKDSLQDRVNGLNLGADDYIVKPFEILELVARVNAVLRRTKKSENIFKTPDITVDFKSRTVTKDNKRIEITPKEFDLLEILIINRNIALSREKLLELAWGYDYMGETRTVDSHIQRLRMKLGWENVIKTVYKLGYRLEI